MDHRGDSESSSKILNFFCHFSLLTIRACARCTLLCARVEYLENELRKREMREITFRQDFQIHVSSFFTSQPDSLRNDYGETHKHVETQPLFEKARAEKEHLQEKELQKKKDEQEAADRRKKEEYGIRIVKKEKPEEEQHLSPLEIRQMRDREQHNAVNTSNQSQSVKEKKNIFEHTSPAPLSSQRKQHYPKPSHPNQNNKFQSSAQTSKACEQPRVSIRDRRKMFEQLSIETVAALRDLSAKN